MPLVKFDIVKGRTSEQIQTLLDAAHRALLTSFKVPTRDRYQVVVEHDASHLVVQDTGLGLKRTNDVVVVSMTSRPRTQAEKVHFYSQLCAELHKSCGIEASDVMISIVTNSDEDWSFGLGEAQFLTKAL